jgi:hypothetical protein
MTLIKKISPLIVITATFVLLALAWNVFVPAYENLDEIEHTEVIRHIAVTGRLPIHGEAEAAGFHVRQEASQPPLYHLVGALWVRLWRLPRSAPTVEAVPVGIVACGDPDTLYNKATWVRPPYTTDVPYAGHRRTVHGLRLLSTLLQVGTLVGTWSLARRLFSRRVAALTTSIVAFNPQFLLVAADVNNDNLVTPLATWALFVLLTIWQTERETEPAPKQLLLLGFLCGLAGLSKLSGLGLLGLSGLVLLIMAVRRHVAFTKLLSWWILVSLAALILTGPWIWRNLQLYGDPTALTPMLEKVGRRANAINPLNESHLMWRSYWGQLPCAFYPRSLYWPWTLLGIVGILGCLLSFKSLTQKQKAGLIGLSAWFILIVAAWVRWNMLTPAPGGRLLFPAAPALALGLALGWDRLGKRVGRRRLIGNVWLVGLPLLALITLRVGLFPIFSPPSQIKERALPTEAPQAYTFGKKIALRAYEIRLRRAPLACWLVRRSYCRPSLDVTFYWEARTSIREDHVMTLQLVSTQPDDDTLRLSYNRWPGRGTLPTSSWPPGSILKDTYLLPLPAMEQPTQAWDVKLGFFDLETERRLAVQQDGVNVGTLAPLTTLRVSGRPPKCDESGALAEEIRFGDAIALTHASVDMDATPQQVTLCWENLASVSEDYTVFVHAYDDAGTLLGTGDAPPMNQAFPTRLWQPGDRVRDPHALTLNQEGNVQRIMIGLYDPQTGARLPAVQAGARLPNDAVTVWEATP